MLKPLADIAPDFIDPLSGQTLATLWQAHPQYGSAFATVELDAAAPELSVTQ